MSPASTPLGIAGAREDARSAGLRWPRHPGLPPARMLMPVPRPPHLAARPRVLGQPCPSEGRVPMRGASRRGSIEVRCFLCSSHRAPPPLPTRSGTRRRPCLGPGLVPVPPSPESGFPSSKGQSLPPSSFPPTPCPGCEASGHRGTAPAPGPTLPGGPEARCPGPPHCRGLGEYFNFVKIREKKYTFWLRNRF